MMIEVRLKTGTRLFREIPYDDMFLFTVEFLRVNAGNWMVIGETAIPVDNIDFIGPRSVGNAQPASKERTEIGFQKGGSEQ